MLFKETYALAKRDQALLSLKASPDSLVIILVAVLYLKRRQALLSLKGKQALYYFFNISFPNNKQVLSKDLNGIGCKKSLDIK